MLTLHHDERRTMPCPPPPPASEEKTTATNLRRLAADVEAGRVPAWQGATLLSVLGVL
jgi:hypothetical protein